MEKTYAGLITLAIFVVVLIGIVQMGTNAYVTTPLLQEPEEENIIIVDQEQEEIEYNIEKEASESGLSRKADGPITAEKIVLLREDWNENDMRRMELSHVRWQNDPKYQPMVIAEFDNGKLSHIESCHDLNSYYLLYYGQVYGNQWDYSNNKDITDYLKERMRAIGCDFKEQAELKGKIDAEKQRVDEAVEEVMKELDEVYKEN